jgi:hypothetical protein
MGNYMPTVMLIIGYRQMGSGGKIGSENSAFSVFYGIDSLPFSEGKPARLIPGRRIIGTADGACTLFVQFYPKTGMRDT